MSGKTLSWRPLTCNINYHNYPNFLDPVTYKIVNYFALWLSAMGLLFEGIWIICKALLKGSQDDRVGRKSWLGCPDWITSLWTLLFWKKTSTVLPRLNFSLSHLQLKTKNMHTHSASVYLRTDFCSSWGRGCVPLLHNSPWIWLHIENQNIIWYHYLIL